MRAVGYDRVTFPLAPVLLFVLLTVQMRGGTWHGVLRPQEVRVEEAIAEGEAAAGKPGLPLSRWRHVVSAPPDRPAVREVMIVTPYYRVAREAYLRALKGERLTPQEASALLKRLVEDYGPFPLGLVLAFSPAPKVLPHPQGIEVRDARGKPLTLRGFTRPSGPSEAVELIFDASGADLRRLTLRVPLEPVQRIMIDLRGVK